MVFSKLKSSGLTASVSSEELDEDECTDGGREPWAMRSFVSERRSCTMPSGSKKSTDTREAVECRRETCGRWWATGGEWV